MLHVDFIYIYMYICVYIHTYETSIHLCGYAYIKCAHMCAYIWIYVCIYICTHYPVTWIIWEYFKKFVENAVKKKLCIDFKIFAPKNLHFISVFFFPWIILRTFIYKCVCVCMCVCIYIYNNSHQYYMANHWNICPVVMFLL